MKQIMSKERWSLTRPVFENELTYELARKSSLIHLKLMSHGMSTLLKKFFEKAS